MKQIILLKATEGSGKSRLTKVLGYGYQIKDVGRFSAHALDYSNLKDYEILRLKELGSMDEEKQGVSTIKFLSSDDQGYAVEITSKDETTGKFTTEEYKIPCITVISSTTRLILDSQFERRAWLFGMDETPEQTTRIREWKSKLELQNSDKLLGLKKITDYEFSSEVYKRFIEQFKPKDIVIPFPCKLLEILGTEVLRVRGDMDKLLNFVKFYAQLNLKRIQKLSDQLYVVSPEVAVEAIQIIKEPLAGMLSKIDKRIKEVFDCLNNIVDIEDDKTETKDGQKPLSTERVIHYNVKGTIVDKKLRERVAVKLGKSEKTIRAFFSQLENSKYVSSDGKKPKTFTLLYDVKEIETKLSGILAKSESANLLMEEMQKETQEWLKTRLEIVSPQEANNFTLTRPQVNISPTVEEKISNPSLPPFQTADTKTNSDNRQIKELPIIHGENENDICCLCHEPLPKDRYMTTVKNGKEVHVTCYKLHMETE